MDLLIIEEFISDRNFAKLFLDKLQLPENYTIFKAYHSLADTDGESDITLILQYPDKKIVAVFQPHTFSRTQEFKDDIAKVLSNADASYVLDIFPAREKQEDYPLVTSESIIKETSNCNAINDENWDQLKQYNEDAVVIFMSPKEIKLMQSYKEYLKN